MGRDGIGLPGLSGLDRLDQPWGGVVSTGSTNRRLSGLDRLDQPGVEWSRQARPTAGRVVSTGSTNRGRVVSTGSTSRGRSGLDRLDQPGAEWSRRARPTGRAEWSRQARPAGADRLVRKRRGRASDGCAGRAQPDDREVPVLRPGEQERVLAPLAPVRPQRGEHALRRGEHLPGHRRGGSPGRGRRGRRGRRGARRLRLDLRGPPHRPPAQPPQRHGHRVVEPDDRVGARPDQVPHGLLVAVGHPPLPRDRRTGPLAQDGQRRGAEARPEVQRVQLHVRYVDQAGQLAREGRLARTGPTEDQDPVAVPERRGQGHGRSSEHLVTWERLSVGANLAHPRSPQHAFAQERQNSAEASPWRPLSTRGSSLPTAANRPSRCWRAWSRSSPDVRRTRSISRTKASST